MRPRSSYTGEAVFAANVAPAKRRKAPDNAPTLAQVRTLHDAGVTHAVEGWCNTHYHAHADRVADIVETFFELGLSNEELMTYLKDHAVGLDA